MPAFRIIPCLDVNAGRVVKGVRFLDLRDVGDPVELARRYRDEGADELVFLDVSATIEARSALLDTVARVAAVLDIPFAVGGGVREEGDALALLGAGADKVAVNSAAVADPGLIERLARRFGSQCVVLAIDARRQAREEGRGKRGEIAAVGFTGEAQVLSHSPRAVPSSAGRSGGWEVVTRAGTTPTGLAVAEWAREGVARGAGEILLTSMDRDGTGLGFDCELLAAVRAVADAPLIASGGGETADHFRLAAAAGADAGLAATIFHEGRMRVSQLKSALAAAGVRVREEAR
ncbi:MAG: imidazole glycerol phosphate synthase subunit HisF [Acidobacteriota bacterium]